MSELRLRLNRSASYSPSDKAAQDFSPLAADPESPSAIDEWYQKRALKLKVSPLITTSYDNNFDDRLPPLKISSSHEHAFPPRYYSSNQTTYNGRIPLKAALFVFMAVTSFTVGAVINWNRHKGRPRCISIETLPSNPYVNQHFRELWLSNVQYDCLNCTQYVETEDNEEDFADLDKTLLSANDSNEKVQKTTGSEEDCVPKASWQTTSYPTCNNIHEIDLTHSIGRKSLSHIFAEAVTGRRFITDYSSSEALQLKQEVDLELKGQGWFRSAWIVDRETSPFKVEYDDDEWDDEYLSEEMLVLKTLRIERDFLEEYYELHRRDAMAMERLTHSKYVLDVYGFCGQSTLNELASHGTLRTMMKYDAHKKKRLKIAYEIAQGVSDMHSIDYADFAPPPSGHGDDLSFKSTVNATMVHYDLNFNNIAVVGGRYPKINDFNVAMFLSWDPKKNATCGFEGRFAEPWYRSPEEMQNHIDDGTDDVPLNEKVDVYSLGIILWGLLTDKPPWIKDQNMTDVLRPRVARGELPDLPIAIANATDLTTVAIKNAMFKCLRFNPEERASAGEVAHDLKKALKEVKRLEKRLEKDRKAREKKAEEATAEAVDEEGAAVAQQLLVAQESEQKKKELIEVNRLEMEKKKDGAEEAAAKLFDREVNVQWVDGMMIRNNRIDVAQELRAYDLE